MVVSKFSFFWNRRAPLLAFHFDQAILRIPREHPTAIVGQVAVTVVSETRAF